MRPLLRFLGYTAAGVGAATGIQYAAGEQEHAGAEFGVGVASGIAATHAPLILNAAAAGFNRSRTAFFGRRTSEEVRLLTASINDDTNTAETSCYEQASTLFEKLFPVVLGFALGGLGGGVLGAVHSARIPHLLAAAVTATLQGTSASAATVVQEEAANAREYRNRM